MAMHPAVNGALSATPAPRGLLGNILAIGLTRGASIVLDGLAYVLIARALAPSDYGQYVAIYALITLVDLAADMTVIDVGVRELTTHPNEMNVWLGGITSLRFLLAAFGSVLFSVYAFLFRSEVKTSLFVLAIVAMLVGSMRTPIAVFRAQMAMHYEFILIASTRLLNLLGVIVIISRGASVASLIGMLVLSRVVLGIGAWTICRLRFHLTAAFEPTVFRNLVTESFPMAVSGALVAIQLKLDVVLVARIVGHAAAGIYGVVAQLPEYLLYLPVVISTPLLPMMSRVALGVDPKEFFRLYGTLVRVSIIIVTPLVVVAATSAHDVTQLLFGGSYAQSAPLLPWIMVAVAFMWVSHAMAISAVAAKLQHHFLWIQAVCAAVYLAMNAGLIPVHGYWGALSARVVGCALAPLLTIFAIRKHVPLFPFDWQYLAVLAAAGGAMWYTLHVLQGTTIIVAGLVAVGTYSVTWFAGHHLLAKGGAAH